MDSLVTNLRLKCGLIVHHVLYRLDPKPLTCLPFLLNGYSHLSAFSGNEGKIYKNFDRSVCVGEPSSDHNLGLVYVNKPTTRGFGLGGLCSNIDQSHERAQLSGCGILDQY